MQIAPESLDEPSTYKLITGIVVPRPIAWVTTMHEGGAVNLAPFSAFTFVSTEPPMVGFNVGLRLGQRKDTANNILRNREFVVNIGSESMIEAIHASSEEHPPSVSESEVLGLETAPGVRIATHRLIAAPASLECRLDQVIRFGRSGAEFFVGEVVMMHVADELYEDGKIDSARMKPAARVGGPVYARLGEFLRMRPVKLSPKRAPGGG